jgi:hypothetical protein
VSWVAHSTAVSVATAPATLHQRRLGCLWVLQSLDVFWGSPLQLLLQLMAVGGNHKARQFFKQHGYDEVGSDKIESKVSIGRQQCSLFRLC